MEKFQSIARRQKNLLHMEKQDKIRSYRTSPQYRYGYQVTCNYWEAMEFYIRHGSTQWSDENKIDIVQLYEYETFKDLGKYSSAPVRYNKIQFHIVYDVKHDRLHKVILVADVHLTDILVEIVYSGVVFLCGIQLLVFIYQLNKMEIWDT